MPRTVSAKKKRFKKQHLGTFGSGKGDWKVGDVDRSEKGRDWRDEIRVGEIGKTVYLGSAGLARTSRVFSVVTSRADVIAFEK